MLIDYVSLRDSKSCPYAIRKPFGRDLGVSWVVCAILQTGLSRFAGELCHAKLSMVLCCFSVPLLYGSRDLAGGRGMTKSTSLSKILFSFESLI